MNDGRRARMMRVLTSTQTELCVRQPDAFCHVFGYLNEDAAGRLVDALLPILDGPDETVRRLPAKRKPSTGGFVTGADR